MTTERRKELSRTRMSVGAIWALAALIGLGILIAAPTDHVRWLSVGLIACILITFIVQLSLQTTQGLVFRISSSIVGSFLILGIVTLATLGYS